MAAAGGVRGTWPPKLAPNSPTPPSSSPPQVTFGGGGPLGGLQAVADSTGRVRGRVDHPAADPPLRPDGKLDVGGAVGSRGVLSVVRSRAGGGEPYTGLTPIVSGEVADDLAHYLATSEQTNCALALGVCLDKAGHVMAAGGWLVQVLPFCSDETLSTLERNVASLDPVSSLLADGKRPADITAALLDGLGVAHGGGFELAPEYGPCDTDGLKQRMTRALALLGEDEARRGRLGWGERVLGVFVARTGGVGGVGGVPTHRTLPDPPQPAPPALHTWPVLPGAGHRQGAGLFRGEVRVLLRRVPPGRGGRAGGGGRDEGGHGRRRRVSGGGARAAVALGGRGISCSPSFGAGLHCGCRGAQPASRRRGVGPLAAAGAACSQLRTAQLWAPGARHSRPHPAPARCLPIRPPARLAY